MVLDVVDLTQCSSDSDDCEAMETEQVVLTHVKYKKVSFYKGSMHGK